MPSKFLGADGILGLAVLGSVAACAKLGGGSALTAARAPVTIRVE